MITCKFLVIQLFFFGLSAISVSAQASRSLELSRTAVFLPCPEGCSSRTGVCKDVINPHDDRTVNVKVIGHNSTSGHIRYAYSVTAGKVVGSGPQVAWDLSGVEKGSYEIVASIVDPAVRFSKPMGGKVFVEDCPDCLCDVECPSIFVMGPDGETEPGKPMTFTANISGGSQDTVTYRWRVSNGSITSGQDTQSILVATTLKMAGKSVTATLEISRTAYQERHGCPNKASATGIVRHGIPRLHK